MRYNYSIIIPHKDIPDLLQRCLDSIPTREDVQIIIVDDNSNPSLVDFQNFPGLNRPNTDIILSKESRGAGGARNEGLLHAEGKWIFFADADDFFAPELNEMLDFYLNSSASIILFPIQVVDSITLKPSSFETFFNETIANDTLSDKEKVISAVTPWSKLIKKELIEDNHIKFDEIRYSNDVMFSAMVGIAAQECIIDSQHFIYIRTEREGSLIKVATKEALRTRLDVVTRFHILIVRHHFTHCLFMFNPKRYILWSAEYGGKEVLRTLYRLIKSGILFHPVYYKGSYHNYPIVNAVRAFRRVIAKKDK